MVKIGEIYIYINNGIKIKHICKKHGEFDVTPRALRSGHGCKKCGYERNSLARQKYTEQSINKNIKDKKVKLVPGQHILGIKKYYNFQCLQCNYTWITNGQNNKEIIMCSVMDRVRKLEPQIREWAKAHGTTAGLTSRWIKTPSYLGGFNDGAVYKFIHEMWIKLDKKAFFSIESKEIPVYRHRYTTIADALEEWESPFTGAHYVEQGLTKQGLTKQGLTK